jgi:uncharacterized protein YyaL (SSP411 family)
MKRKIVFIILLIIIAFLVPSDFDQTSRTYKTKYNRLAQEKSPYLLQHKDNPVNWFPWGKEAFEAAHKENKLIFLSIGYSTCYWCHVMEKDSYENEEVAQVLNDHFISIKVDREEHPDVDQVYMDAVVSLTGQGGWPLNTFLTPDLKPFFGGTFFRRDQFIPLLNKIAEEWETRPDAILNSSEKITEALKLTTLNPSTAQLNENILRNAFAQLKERFDSTYGGFGGAPKFPRSMNLSLLLRIYRRTGNEEALKMVTTTLDQMARGGIYDHLGGGFHRYSTDEKWFIPHFEKMLYDNALLAVTYLEAYQVTGKNEYSQVARETLDYVLREMTDPQGGFYSAEDAGEVGAEGEFYLWSEEELKRALTPEQFQLFKKTYGITSEGNFENGKNILYLKNTLSPSPVEGEGVKIQLFKIRDHRPHPRKDDKILTSWNGLMIAAMAKGYQVLGDERYLKAAQKSALFIKNHLMEHGELLRRYREGESRYRGTLEDYAFLMNGLLNLYESNFDEQWIRWAHDLQNQQDKLFWDEKKGGYFFSEQGDPTLILRKKEYDDHAIPSANSMAALNLLRLHDFTFEEEYQKKAEKVFESIASELSQFPSSFPQLLIALDYYLDRAKEIAVIKNPNHEDTASIQQYLYKTFLPNKVMAIGNETPMDASTVLTILKGKKAMDGKTTIYVCEKNICKLPTHDLEQAKSLINDFKRYKLNF